ncbi:hypothetical protein HYS30_00275 [Candidatus Peregrinibacteria bacterium]|nr:hypothetical protein [Candidatus Peregrinibacteria bacterium]
MPERSVALRQQAAAMLRKFAMKMELVRQILLPPRPPSAALLTVCAMWRRGAPVLLPRARSKMVKRQAEQRVPATTIPAHSTSAMAQVMIASTPQAMPAPSAALR